MRLNQLKIIRFNHLLANILIFQAVVYQTKAINKLRRIANRDTESDIIGHFDILDGAS
jgi:hypothetical protein